MAGDPQLEVIFPVKSGQASGREMHVVFTRLGIRMIRLSAIEAHAVAEIPVIREHRSPATAMGRKPQRRSRIPFRRMVRGHAGSNRRNMGINYFNPRTE